MATSPPGTQYLQHVTTDGERWDQLADRYYGDPLDYVRIIDANPNIPIYPLLPAGLVVFVPILDEDDVLSAALPPWKQAT